MIAANDEGGAVAILQGKRDLTTNELMSYNLLMAFRPVRSTDAVMDAYLKMLQAVWYADQDCDTGAAEACLIAAAIRDEP